MKKRRLETMLIMQRPLYLNDGKCVMPNFPLRMETIDHLNKEINNGTLKLVKNSCLCHNDNPSNDIIISEKDRYGFSVPQIICSKCGLIRSGLVLDEKSNRSFYEKYYRKIYLASDHKPIDVLWVDEYQRGRKVLHLVKKYISLDGNARVTEVGCGAGGCLEPFREEGLLVSGYDFDKDYLVYGVQKGLTLYYGDFYELSEDSYFDLIILNHVFEHFLDPINEIKRILTKVKPGKYIFIEVPGIFCIHKVYFNPICYFQNAHVYNYYKDYLTVFFEKMGLHVVYGDEGCRFIVQKVDDKIKNTDVIYDECLSVYPKLIYKYLNRTYKYQIYYRMLAKLKYFLRNLY